MKLLFLTVIVLAACAPSRAVVEDKNFCIEERVIDSSGLIVEPRYNLDCHPTMSACHEAEQQLHYGFAKTGQYSQGWMLHTNCYKK